MTACADATTPPASPEADGTALPEQTMASSGKLPDHTRPNDPPQPPVAMLEPYDAGAAVTELGGGEPQVNRAAPVTEECQTWIDEARNTIADVIESSALGCATDADCSLYSGSTLCTPTCGVRAALKTAQEAIAEARTAANEGPCTEFYGAMCRGPATPRCGGPDSVLENALCADGTCVVEQTAF